MRRSWFLFLLSFLTLGGMSLPACTPVDDDDTDDDDDDDGDDDDSGGDDDDSGVGDDDDATNDPPVFLNSFDFRLVQLKNDVTGEFAVIQGQMDIFVSQTVFLAELSTTGGDEWSWQGPLVVNEERFEVTGEMTLPGVDSFWITIEGNFLGGADRKVSRTCLTGIGEDNDTLNQGVIGIEFAWYGCQVDAEPAAIDRAGSYAVTANVAGDNCGGVWMGTPNWTEQWQFDGRILQVTRGAFTGYGIVSDDGQVFRLTWLEAANPGRSLKVVGDFTAPTGNEEATAIGYCSGNTTGLPGGVLQINYP
ncbi:MAG: hypothetical protein KDA24_11005 [Deltaproteobacteria bacterium]|nr:hypothetical protein [Deltaproteobacteria bacterium]